MKDRTRKICSVLLTLTLFVGILLPMGAAPAQAMSTNPAGFAYEVNGDGTIEITRLPNDYFNTGIADIPATIDGQKVTALDKDLFVSGLSEVTVPGTVAAIPDYLFRLDNQGSDGLKKVVLKDGVKKIGRESFAFQVGLSSVTLSNELTEIGGSAFQGCTALARIDLPSSLTTIGGSAFMSSGLTAVVLPDSVREVGAQAFRNCSKLQSVTLSSGMTTISARLFENADKLTTVTIPASIQSIGEDAFNGCDSLKTIYFGGTQAQWNELTSYPNMASQGNEILKNVKVIFANGESSDPSTPTEPEDSAIPVPVDLTAENTVDGVKLSWSIPLEVGDVKWEYDEFVVARELANGTGSEIGHTSRGVYSYLDKDVKDGESYTYIVCALKDNAESGGFSEEVSITYDANPFTTTTIRDAAIRIGNQEDGSTNFTGVDKLWLTTGAQGMRIDLIFPEEMDELKNQQLSVTVSGGTRAAWLEGSGSVTMQGLTDEITLADSDLNITADGASARVNFDRGVEAVSVSGSGTLGLSASVGDVTMRFSGTAANGVTLTRDDDTLAFSGADSGSVVVSEGNATLESTTITPGQDVSVSFAGETEQPDEPASDLPYRDVRANDWFYDAVKFVSDEKLMTGTGANTFAPNLTTTRGMIVSILYRLEGGPQINGSSPFTDVKDDDWYGDAVRWAERAGVVSGTSATTFAPNAAITREQLAAILMNYANYKHENTSARADLSKYSDAGKISSWANDVMAWAVSKGYISGMTATTLAPQGSATRAQVAAILQRYLAD